MYVNVLLDHLGEEEEAEIIFILVIYIIHFLCIKKYESSRKGAPLGSSPTEARSPTIVKDKASKKKERKKEIKTHTRTRHPTIFF